MPQPVRATRRLKNSRLIHIRVLERQIPRRGLDQNAPIKCLLGFKDVAGHGVQRRFGIG